MSRGAWRSGSQGNGGAVRQMLDGDEIRRIVFETVRKQLAPCCVDVRMQNGTDEDGDPVLYITVIIEAGKSPDTGKMLGLARHIRASFTDDTPIGFPLLSFVSRHDASKMDLETA